MKDQYDYKQILLNYFHSTYLCTLMNDIYSNFCCLFNHKIHVDSGTVTVILFVSILKIVIKLVLGNGEMMFHKYIKERASSEARS